MLKSIMVVLDKTESSAAARRIAIDAAGRTGAELVALAVVDAPWITEPRATPIGATHFQAHRNAILLVRGRQDVRALLDECAAECQAANVRCVVVGREGKPAEQIDDESDKADLVVLGKATNFRGDDAQEIGATIEQLLEDTARPLIIAPEMAWRPKQSNTVVVGFDGSSTSSRAMHMFILLGLAAGKKVHVVSVGEDGTSARGCAERGATLFRNHGITAAANPVTSEGGHADALLGAAATVDADLIVMGAKGKHSLLRRALVGSTTIAMLRTARLPIFVHH